jgi:TolB-like protein/tetratricopeptide (TPR) repeat protein
VLPFVNLSADPAFGYFSDGLTAELTDSLARIKGLRVVASSSASTFKGKAVNVSDVGRALSVAEVLEGTVERSEGKVKVVAHLERTSDGSILWSNTYVRPASDLFAVQTELATGVAASLSVAAGLPDPKSRHVPNSRAHDLVMNATFEMNQNTPAALELAEVKLRNAIELDPAYAAAYYDLALVTNNTSNANGSTYVVNRSRIEPLLRKALQLDPDLQAAHAMLGMLAMEFDWDWAGAEREMQLATSGAPDSNAEGQYALLLTFRGRFAEADRHAARSLDLSPLGTATLMNFAQVRHLEGRLGQALEVFQRLGGQFPRMVAPRQMMAQISIEEGRPELALPIVQQLKAQFPTTDCIEASALAKEGRRQDALRLLRPLEDKYPETGIPMQWIALAYASMDDEPNTVKWLERSADRHEFQALNLAVHPAYAHLRNSPQFLALEKRMGLEGVSPH